MINKEEKLITFWVIMIYYYCFKMLNWISTLSLEMGDRWFNSGLREIMTMV